MSGFTHDPRPSKVPHLKATLPVRSVLLSTVGTSLAVHGGLSVGTWALGTLTDRAEVKDWLWPSGSVVNAWYQSVGRAVFMFGVPVGAAISSLRWQEKLLVSL